MSENNIVCKTCSQDCKNEFVYFDKMQYNCEYYELKKRDIKILDDLGVDNE